MTVAEVAKLIDHALLHPTLSTDDIRRGVEHAHSLHVASVCVRPCDVPIAVARLVGSDVVVGTVVGFPHGTNSTRTKVDETRIACGEGAAEIDVVINVGRTLESDWRYVGDEISAVNQAAVDAGAICKVIFETGFVRSRDHLDALCRLCIEADVAYVKTSTGFAFVKDDDGDWQPTGAQDDVVRFLRDRTPSSIGVKASGGIRSLDDVLRLHALGATRVGTSSTERILREARERLPA